MVELLALHPITKIDELMREVPPPSSGVPINALPGWNRVPLCNKLPMLNTPKNEIIFSRDKLGKKLWKPSEYVLYDPNCYTVKIEYDSLHDPHLMNYFCRQANFERIKAIGKVTENKDVLCTLKDFNSYRRYLRRLHLDLVNDEIRRRELIQHDKFLINMAEEVARKDMDKMTTTIYRTKSEIFRNKETRERQRAEQAMLLYKNFNRTIEKIGKIKEWKKETLREKSRMHNLERRHRIKHAIDLERMRIIALKKKFKMREIQRVKFLKNRSDEEHDQKMLKAQESWRRRVEFRAYIHHKNKELRAAANIERKINVQKREETIQKKWNRIQLQIAEKSIQRTKKDLLNDLAKKLRRKMRKKRKSTKPTRNGRKELSKNDQTIAQLGTASAAIGAEQILNQDSANRMARKSSIKQSGQRRRTTSTALFKASKENIEDALSTAMTLHDIPLTDQESTEKIVTSAKYILEKVLKSVNRNLGDDFLAREYMCRRVEDLFARVKKHVLQKVERILSAFETIESFQSGEISASKSCHISKSLMLPLWGKENNTLLTSMSKTVSFGEIAAIGRSTQHIDSNMDLKSTRTRTPTPASSLTSLTAVVKETITDEDIQIPLRNRDHQNYKPPTWSVNERIFVEHFYIKFKKGMLVGVERAVLDAIDLKKREFRMNPRREILELDRAYLTNIMAESILTYNLNSFNFFGNIRLCISALAAECLYDLKSSSLKAKYDPAYQVEPHCRCNIGAFGCRQH